MLPTFLGLGSGRCASTWLHQTLQLHPQILLTSPKEVNFFGKYCIVDSLQDYRNKFRPSSDKPNPPVRGDISPRYAWLSRQGIVAAHRLLPEAKLVLVMRNPVERAWSHVLMELAIIRHRDVSEVPIATFLRMIERARHIHVSDYQRIINDWTSVFGRDALHVDLYDRLCTSPRDFLCDLLMHIGADPSWDVPEEQLVTRCWSSHELTGGQSDDVPMPPIVRWYLSLQWRDRVRQLNEQLGGRVSHWVREIDRGASMPAPRSWKLRRWANRSILKWPERLAYGAFNTARECALVFAYRRLQREQQLRRTTPVKLPHARAAVLGPAVGAVFGVVMGLVVALMQAAATRVIG